ncbi:MAG TPA: cytochrome c [Anaerolineae bacterium]|nr:cytochrome c [Anaerolineae bacterium]HMR62901.1 cytochrome c [Anaerolineae bacterium]
MKNPSYLILVLTVVLAVSLTACGGGGAAAPAAEAAPPTPAGNAANGKALFEQATIGKSNALGCATCHSLEPDVTLVGPSLAGIADRAGSRVDGLSAEAYLRQSITAPNEFMVEGFAQNLMPLTFAADLSEEQINDLIAYLLTIKG